MNAAGNVVGINVVAVCKQWEKEKVSKCEIGKCERMLNRYR